MTDPSAFHQQEKYTKQLVRVTSVIYILLLLPAIALDLYVLQVFTEPGAFGNRGYWFMGIAALTLIPVLIVSVFGSRWLVKEKDFKHAKRMALLPLLNLIIYFAGFLISRIY